MNIYVSSKTAQGGQHYNGFIPEANSDASDGPLSTLEEACKHARRMREQNQVCGPVHIYLRGGRYNMLKPLELGPNDRDLFIHAYENETPILDGSVVINNWEESQINGRPCWIASIDRELEYIGEVRSLFANDERRPRSRYPKEGWLVMDDVPDVPPGAGRLYDGSSRFIPKVGDFDANWKNQTQIEAVINHLWVEERMPIASFDEKRREIRTSRSSMFTLRNQEWMDKEPCARYYWENVFEALSEPGEWYADPESKTLYYLPREGETIENTEIRLPHLKQLIRIHGNRKTGEKAHGIHIDGLHFRNTDYCPTDGYGKWWDPETEPHEWEHKDSFNHFNATNLQWSRTTPYKKGTQFAAMPQAAHDLPGAISFEWAQDCSVSRCSLSGIGFYGFDIRRACHHLRFSGNTLQDIGAGGFKLDGSDAFGNQDHRTHHIYVGDNRLERCGQIYSSAIGIIILHSGFNRIEHNEITNQKYTAISCGWVWDFDESSCKENLILNNYIHDIGLGIMSDLGGIYTLGSQPGCVIKGNHIHNVKSNHYGGNGIYLDEGSSMMRVEENLIYDADTLLSEHWARQVVYQNNIFAFPRYEGVVLSREETHGCVSYPLRGNNFLKNVFVVNGKPIVKDACTYLKAIHSAIQSDFNVYWDYEKKEALTFWNYEPWPEFQEEAKTYTLSEIQELGIDQNSQTIDPGFVDADARDFRLKEDSPLHKLLQRIPSASNAGIRPESEQGRFDVVSTGRKFFSFQM